MLTKNLLMRQVQIVTPLILVALLLISCGQPTASPNPATATSQPTPKTTPTSAATASNQPSPVPPTAPAAKLDQTELDKYIVQLMTLYDVPGAAVGIVRDGQVIFTKGYGVRDITTKQPVTENTLFAIGSITKSFTALAIMQLVEQGKLELDAPVIKFLPEFKLADPQATQQVTLRQLLSMSSGLPRNDADLLLGKTRQQILDSLPNLQLTAKPGELWQYSNQAYTVAGLVIERVSGQSWEDYIRQHILAPLGMKTATLDIASLQKATEYAVPHTLDILKGLQPIPFTDLTGFAPAGAINASVTEMAAYLQFQLGNGSLANGARLLTTQSFEQMHAPQMKIQSDESYGLGWVISQYQGNKVFAHNGGITGFYADSNLLPASKAGVIVLTIAPDDLGSNLFAHALIIRVTDLLLGLKPDATLTDTLNQQANFNPAQRKANLAAARSYNADPATFSPLLGDYTGSLGQLIVSTNNNKLFVEVVAGSAKGKYELIPFKAGWFLGNSAGINGQTFEFKTDPNGTILINQEGLNIGQKLGANAKLTQYKDPQGRFSASVPAELTVQQQGTVAQIQSTNPPGTFWLTALDSSSDELAVSVKKFLTQRDPTFNLAPLATQPIPVAEEHTWTQFLYQLPDDQLLAVVAIKQKNTTYLLAAQAKSADVAALTPNFNALLLNFKING